MQASDRLFRPFHRPGAGSKLNASVCSNRQPIANLCFQRRRQEKLAFRSCEEELWLQRSNLGSEWETMFALSPPRHGQPVEKNHRI